MEKDNNVISFENLKEKRKKNKYDVKAEISIWLLKNGCNFTLDWRASGDGISKTDSNKSTYEILEKILDKLSSELSTIEYISEEFYEIYFTLMYLEDNKGNFKYIYIPEKVKDKSNKKLAEFLLIVTSIFEVKNPES